MPGDLGDSRTGPPRARSGSQDRGLAAGRSFAPAPMYLPDPIT